MPAKRKAAPPSGWQARETASNQHANFNTFRLIRQQITDIFVLLLCLGWEVAR